MAHTLDPWNNICNGIFGFPAKSEFMKLVLLNLPVKTRLNTLADNDKSYRGYGLEVSYVHKLKEMMRKSKFIFFLGGAAFV